MQFCPHVPPDRQVYPWHWASAAPAGSGAQEPPAQVEQGPLQAASQQVPSTQLPEPHW
ncbi:MAG: hypothetical protein RL653_2068 [Pseudomonadota bacterium]